ncbi:hypothetical protein HY469_05170 [Candidatus Roizmanbacteria bacterium]|nr:hypothetical protein [Candidatus Roizmanbacteria bacterium]
MQSKEGVHYLKSVHPDNHVRKIRDYPLHPEEDPTLNYARDSSRRFAYLHIGEWYPHHPLVPKKSGVIWDFVKNKSINPQLKEEPKTLLSYADNAEYRDNLIFIYEMTLTIPCLNHWTPDVSDQIHGYLNYYKEKLLATWYKANVSSEELKRVHCLEVAIDTIL